MYFNVNLPCFKVSHSSVFIFETVSHHESHFIDILRYCVSMRQNVAN